MFHLYLIRLGLFYKNGMVQTVDGFEAVVEHEKPKKEDFTNVQMYGKQWLVFLSRKDIQENEKIKNQFFQ